MGNTVDLPLWYLLAAALIFFLLGLWSRHIWETDVTGDDADPTEGYWCRAYHDLLHAHDVDRNRHAARVDYRRRHQRPLHPVYAPAGYVTDAPAWTYETVDDVADVQLEAAS